MINMINNNNDDLYISGYDILKNFLLSRYSPNSKTSTILNKDIDDVIKRARIAESI